MSLLNPVDKSFCLEQLCAANYQRLFSLIPELTSINKAAIGIAQQPVQLYLKIIERTQHTLTIQLSHCFNENLNLLFVPDVIIRVYLDAQLAEVLRDYARDTVNRSINDLSLSKDIMNYKWRLNYFLQKWLEHCLKQHYLFTISQ